MLEKLLQWDLVGTHWEFVGTQWELISGLFNTQIKKALHFKNNAGLSHSWR